MANRGTGRGINTTKGRHVYGDSQDRVKRISFGLGQAPSPAAAEKCLRCSFGNVPVIEEVVWTIDSTFLINGILQTDILTQGVGVHVFCEPMSFATIGNAWVAPPTPIAPPPSPDVYTLNDIENGALTVTSPPGVNTETYFPASLEWGASVWRAGWNFINAYQFQWRTSQRELVLNELAADISYFGSFADAEAAGTSEVPIIEFVATVNATYRSKDSSTIFLPVNFRRVGSIGTGGANLGIFHPTRDFDLAPVTWGGLRWQGYGCRGQMYRPVESPCFLERGIPIGMQFVVQDAVHQASMLESLTINNEPFGTNVLPDVNVTAGPTVGGAVTNTSTMLEQTLDTTTPLLVPQQVFVGNQVFKGGVLKLAIKLKGWEMPGGWKAYCQSNAIAGMAPSVGA